MEGYRRHHFPAYKSGIAGLVEIVKEFLDKNYSKLSFEQKKTAKGSFGFIAPYTEGSTISIFIYNGQMGTPMLELYWNEAGSNRNLSVKIPVSNNVDWDNTSSFLSVAMPLLSDLSLNTTVIPDDTLIDAMAECTSACDLHGALISVSGDISDNMDSESAEGMEMRYKKPDPVELQKQIDAALDKGDKDEFIRLSDMANESKLAGLKNLKDYNNFFL